MENYGSYRNYKQEFHKPRQGITSPLSLEPTIEPNLTSHLYLANHYVFIFSEILSSHLLQAVDKTWTFGLNHPAN